MEEFGCRIMSWGPLAEGRNNFFTNELLSKIGKTHGKSVAQVALRFLLQRNVIIIPKSTHKERMAQNLDIFDFTLDQKEMKQIASLNQSDSGFINFSDMQFVKHLIETYG